MFRSIWVALALVVLAAAAAPGQEEREVEPVVVTSTRLEVPLSQVSESVTVIAEEEILRSQA